MSERSHLPPACSPSPSLLLPACLVVLAMASAALGFAFYFRGEAGDYHLYYVEEDFSGGNEYVPAWASRTLAFPHLAEFAALWGALVGGGWLALAGVLVRREGRAWRQALAKAAPAFYPLILLLAVPAHHFLGLPLTLGPVFLMILCVGLCVGAGGYVAGIGPGRRATRAAFSAWSVVVLSAGYAAFFSALLLRQYWALRLGFPDSGMFAEALFQASRGEGLRTHWEATGVALHAHCFLILAPLSYLYRLWPAHETLFVLQSVALASGGVAVYLLGQSVVRDRLAAWCLAVAYLVAPTTAFVNLPADYGFRPMALLPALVLWAVVFLERRRVPWYFLFLVLALLTKETAAPIVVMLGVYVAVRHRRWGLAGATVALGAGYYVFVTRVAVPYVFGQAYDFTPLLSRFGDSAGEVLWNVVRRPGDFLRTVLGERPKLFLLLHLAVPLLCLPLLSASAAVVWGASFAILAMARYFGKHVIWVGAQSPALPGLYLAAVCGLGNLGRWGPRLAGRLRPRWRPDAARLVRAAALGALASAGLAGCFFFVRTVPWRHFEVSPRAEVVEEIRRLTPRSGSLWTTCRLGAHFTDQEALYVSGKHWTEADYMVLDLRDAWEGLPRVAAWRNRLLRSDRYAAVFAREGFLVFERSAPDRGLAAGYTLDAEPTPRYRVGRTLGGFATLVGYDAAQAGTRARLTLYWRCEAATEADLAVVLRLARRDGEPLTLWYLPADGLLPTWAWEAGQVIVDTQFVDGIALPRGGEPIRQVHLEPVPEP
ncbi:MAG: DUF2079 domain-containing protein [Candidatus Brocadiia bacterium]